ncbi:hypothetical protein P152DRAFT_48370 [Eremomyces bilateralis CBS 781.70]|uniref:N-acetyltransferase domain-containing protein n=1 Tax=Eremomyces bilateralis CBS 781.70 TaxID=1392243 RepID=A0A6G1G0U1_9PEZI|nr:uncharacterized protein P152DRAFT_48370 [Eremomyces bilateralis CBS 781.70]KAF1811674.1 hypothetical protein P152DRAFT_48370 [Eremomyces bilateralis CBS 781.70]
MARLDPKLKDALSEETWTGNAPKFHVERQTPYHNENGKKRDSRFAKVPAHNPRLEKLKELGKLRSDRDYPRHPTDEEILEAERNRTPSEIAFEEERGIRREQIIYEAPSQPWTGEFGGFEPFPVVSDYRMEGRKLILPTQWETRPGFSGCVDAEIMDWRKVVAEVCGVFVVPIHQKGFHGEVNLEVACNLWVPKDIDGMDPTEFWSCHVVSELAAQCDVAKTDRPWWELLIDSRTLHVMRPWIQPETVLDPLDSKYAAARAEENTSEGAIMHALKLEAERQQAKDAKMAKKAEEAKRIREEVARIPERPPNPNTPKANIYIRPALVTDLVQAAEIYKHYAKNTVHAPDLDMTPARMRDIFDDVAQCGLPFFVALLRGKSKSQRANRNRDPNYAEKLVGFCFGQSHSTGTTVYGITADVQIYVEPKWLQKGISNCLMDRMLWGLDKSYLPRDGYLWEHNHDTGEWTMPGGNVEVTNVVVKVLYESDYKTNQGADIWAKGIEHVPEDIPVAEKIRKKVLASWLLKWGFKKVGETDGIGSKKFGGKVHEVGESVYRLRTGESKWR